MEKYPEERALGESLLGVLSEAPSREKTAACRAPSCVAGLLFLAPPSPWERSGAPVAGFSCSGAPKQSFEAGCGWVGGWVEGVAVSASPSSRRHGGG